MRFMFGKISLVSNYFYIYKNVKIQNVTECDYSVELLMTMMITVVRVDDDDLRLSAVNSG